MGDEAHNLPPGFRFFPTDEELVVHFLYPKVARLPPCHSSDIIPCLDLYSYDPWDLSGFDLYTCRALAGGREWYFFSRRTQNRSTTNGYWKPTGMEEPVVSANRRFAIKKYLVFYCGAAPEGIKTNWMMNEYHLLADCRPRGSRSSGRRASRKRGQPESESDAWIICRVYEGSSGSEASFYEDGDELSCLDEVFLSLDDLDEISLPNN